MAAASRRKQMACPADAPISPAVVRLYGRAIEIENEVEEEIVDRMSVKDLLAWPCRHIKNAKARRLRAHREYKWVRAELVRLLGFDPFNPRRDDARAQRLSFELTCAFLDQLMWWKRSSQSHLRVVT